MPREARAPGDVLTILYNSRAWARCRASVLMRDGYQCVACHESANTVHHLPPGARALIEQGRDPCDHETCVTLCHACHGAADGSNAHVHKPKVNRFMSAVGRKRA